MNRRFWSGVVAYFIATSVVAIPWHMGVFAEVYTQLKVFRQDVILPLGLFSMLMQGAIFSWTYPRLFDTGRTTWCRSGLRFSLWAGLLAWSCLVLPIAAKYHMASVGGFVMVESAFVAVWFLVAGPMMAFAHRTT